MMVRFTAWLKGKKTYVVAALLLGATLQLLVSGHLTPTTALTVLMFAATLFPATFRAALAQHQAEELQLLGQIAAAGAAVTVHNYGAAERSGAAAVAEGIRLVNEVEAQRAASDTSGVNSGW
jgi:hypothetical protein